MLVFGPTLHHPSTKHQALVKNIKMQHLANLLENNPKKKFHKVFQNSWATKFMGKTYY
jgi:hypothetical protein